MSDSLSLFSIFLSFAFYSNFWDTFCSNPYTYGFNHFGTHCWLSRALILCSFSIAENLYYKNCLRHFLLFFILSVSHKTVFCFLCHGAPLSYKSVSSNYRWSLAMSLHLRVRPWDFHFQLYYGLDSLECIPSTKWLVLDKSFYSALLSFKEVTENVSSLTNIKQPLQWEGKNKSLLPTPEQNLLSRKAELK